MSGQTPLKDRSGSGHPDQALAAMSSPINGGKAGTGSPLSRGGGQPEPPAPSSAVELGAAAKVGAGSRERGACLPREHDTWKGVV